MGPYDPKKVEPKWQKVWEETGLYKTTEDPKKENHYCLTMFPYPSGDLHTGHWYAYCGPDILARQARMSGKNVLYPMGFDAFGLPAENAAIKNKIPPAKWTAQNIATMSTQLHRIGAMYDWDRVIDTSKPEYYRWTQWLFLKLHEMGLAYRKQALVNWCPKDKTVLANEQVVGDKNVCERCGTAVVQKDLEQWYFKITDYAEALLADLEELDWPKRVKIMQQNWIGKSQGAEVDFEVAGSKDKITVFTTRPDTLFGATYMVLAPEHPLVAKITSKDQAAAVKKYVEAAGHKTELDRMEEGSKTGVFTGAYAINPVNKGQIPIWVSDYVLMSYGTGAIMAVPAHDERDFEFATKFKLEIRAVIEAKELPFAGEGKLINSGKYDGSSSAAARKQIVVDLAKTKMATAKTNYRLRDWLISRQRYWGAPIPIIYCDKCGIQPVPAKDLPVLLPEDVEFEPTGKSPLLARDDFVKTNCPNCGGASKRETDTMDTFVDSSWYYLRYPNPSYDKGPFDPAEVKKWLPVQHYLGGIEHAILHLLYSRFVTKALHTAKEVDFKEPFLRLSNQGVILGPDSQKMSKSRGNVVNPDDQVDAYGADTFRAYLMFTGPWEQGGPFDTKGIAGLRRFLDRVWSLVRDYKRESVRPVDQADNQAALETELQVAAARTAKKVSADIERLSFNTAISAMMELVNDMYKLKAELPFGASAEVWRTNLEALLLLLAPFAPHITEELWHELGNEASVHVQAWPAWDEELLKEDLVTIVVQVNGKLRASLALPAGVDKDAMIKAAMADTKVAEYLRGKKVSKTIAVPGRLVNFVAS